MTRPYCGICFAMIPGDYDILQALPDKGGEFQPLWTMSAKGCVLSKKTNEQATARNPIQNVPAEIDP